MQAPPAWSVSSIVCSTRAVEGTATMAAGALKKLLVDEAKVVTYIL